MTGKNHDNTTPTPKPEPDPSAPPSTWSAPVEDPQARPPMPDIRYAKDLPDGRQILYEAGP